LLSGARRAGLAAGEPSIALSVLSGQSLTRPKDSTIEAQPVPVL
jgi:hypothetical protein